MFLTLLFNYRFKRVFLYKVTELFIFYFKLNSKQIKLFINRQSKLKNIFLEINEETEFTQVVKRLSSYVYV